MVDAYGCRRVSGISSQQYSPRLNNYSTSSYSNHHSSFSSSLLDAIYRSIDQAEEEMLIYGDQPAAMGKKKHNHDAKIRSVFKSQEEMANFQRASMIDKWMEKKVSQKVADVQMKKSRKNTENSSSSSSDSSCGGGFLSSSGADSFPVPRPKPVRTGVEKEKHNKSHRDFDFSRRDRRVFADELEQQPKHEGGFSKTKSRALKIYGDLKKVKQPISPGGKLAGFLNSLFTGGNVKKPKIHDDSPTLKSANASTCSSASSFSRSCLSKTPSSRGKSSNGVKRSVRFSPVSVIVGEDRQPYEQESSYHLKQTQISNSELANNKKMNSIRSVIQEELMARVMDKNRRVEELAKDLLRNYQQKNRVENEFEFSFDHSIKGHIENQRALHQDFEHDEDDDDDDGASYASSDLFELDNLSAIGMEGKYTEELPVYETTHLDTNRAIANGLIL